MSLRTLDTPSCSAGSSPELSHSTGMAGDRGRETGEDESEGERQTGCDEDVVEDVNRVRG